jgi:uncharacterized protein (TIGR00725 family)
VTARPLAGWRVSVFGSSTLAEGTEGWRLAVATGSALATAGAEVANGGYGGAMAAVSQGVREAGGHVTGVTLDGFRDRTPNVHLSERVHTDTLIERLEVLFRSDAFIVLEGSVGTLTELFLAWNHAVLEHESPRPIVCLGMTWPGFLAALQSLRLVDDRALLALVPWAKDAEEAVQMLARAKQRKSAIGGK